MNKSERLAVRSALIHARESRADCELAAQHIRRRIDSKLHDKRDEMLPGILDLAAADAQKVVDSLEDLLR